MAQTIDIKAVRNLCAKQRLKLWDAIWESLAEEDPASIPVADEVVAEMERRLEWAREHPDECLTHKQFKAKMRKLTK